MIRPGWLGNKNISLSSFWMARVFREHDVDKRWWADEGEIDVSIKELEGDEPANYIALQLEVIINLDLSYVI